MKKAGSVADCDSEGLRRNVGIIEVAIINNVSD